MLWSLTALAAFSWVVYRRARDADRNPLGWVLILWASTAAGAVAGMSLGAVLQGIGLHEVAVPVCGLIGLALPAVIAVRAAGRPIPVTKPVVGAEPAPLPPMPRPPTETPADGLCPHCRVRLPAVSDAFCPECREPLR